MIKKLFYLPIDAMKVVIQGFPTVKHHILAIPEREIPVTVNPIWIILFKEESTGHIKLANSTVKNSLRRI